MCTIKIITQFDILSMKTVLSKLSSVYCRMLYLRKIKISLFFFKIGSFLYWRIYKFASSSNSVSFYYVHVYLLLSLDQLNWLIYDAIRTVLSWSFPDILIFGYDIGLYNSKHLCDFFSNFANIRKIKINVNKIASTVYLLMKLDSEGST